MVTLFSKSIQIFDKISSAGFSEEKYAKETFGDRNTNELPT